MRFLTTFLLIIVYQFSFGQISCDSVTNELKLGDLPPGCFICSSTVQGDNIGYTPDDNLNYTFFCGEVENSRWYTFETGRFNFVELTLTILSTKTGAGLEMAIFYENFNAASSCASLKNGNSITLRYRLDQFQRYLSTIGGWD